MPIEGRPTIQRRQTTERTLEHEIPAAIVQAALRYWMKRNFAEYRAFADDEIEFEFTDDGSAKVHCYSTKSKGKLA